MSRLVGITLVLVNLASAVFSIAVAASAWWVLANAAIAGLIAGVLATEDIGEAR